ncbi:MAG: hypothetical protein ACLQKY_08690 [Terracidiphilus sp.]
MTWTGEAALDPGTKLMQEIRLVELPHTGDIENIAFPEMLSVKFVPVAQVLDAPKVEAPDCAPPPEFPMIVIPIPLGTVIPLAHVQVPDGI